jgi:hypothetical protein
VAAQLRLPLVPVTAVSVAGRRGTVARRLRAYKDAPVGERRAEALVRLVDLVDRWMAAGGRVPAGPVVTVPSTARPGPPPVDRLVAAVPSLAARWCPDALAVGPTPTGHLGASRDGFRLGQRAGDRLREAGGGTAVVVDDAYTTGARAQSAAACLRTAGIRVTGILVVARLCDGPGVPEDAPGP